MRFSFIAASLAAVPLALASTLVRADVCFTVLDAGGKVLHQSRRAPVDMSRPISETLYSRFPNASVMVFGTNNDQCEEMSVSPQAPARAQPRRVARRMQAG